ncbi:MAG: exopolysaccharide biosynthesis polyprenyl glycosylphosphotransferase [Rhodospirillaceae bacterium]|nr:exopolysaccharide biosynthesis polyprenyl glycosylphosphotransferase [Rhodospirillaceae bacterium]
MRIALIGAGPLGEALIEYLHSDDTKNAHEIVGVFDERSERLSSTVAGEPVQNGLAGLRRLIEHEAIDAIIITLYDAPSERMFEIIERIGTTAVDIYLPREHKDQEFPWNEYCELGGLPFLRIKGRPFRGFPAMFKTIEDGVLAFMALILTSPILLLAALALRLESPGPIMIRQWRIGLDGHLFPMFKLRSMHHDPTDDGRLGAVEEDPRITRVGAFLRASSIDELPQILNVLRGEMSVIGPRPHVPNMLVEGIVYGETVSEYVARHRIKPGITGWAQVNGMRSGIHDIEKARRGVQLDLFYIENWTPWLDIKIIFRTVLGVFFSSSAF